MFVPPSGSNRLGLYFGNYGDHRQLRWWVLYPYNCFVLMIALALVMFTAASFIGGTITTRLLLVGADLCVALPAVRYYRLAVSDSRAGTKWLSKRAFTWCLVVIGEFLVFLVAGVIIAQNT